MYAYSSLSTKHFIFFVMSEIRTGTCLNNERMLLNFNTIYNVCESHVACNRGIHPEFDGFYLPHVTVESVHAD